MVMVMLVVLLNNRDGYGYAGSLTCDYSDGYGYAGSLTYDYSDAQQQLCFLLRALLLF